MLPPPRHIADLRIRRRSLLNPRGFFAANITSEVSLEEEELRRYLGYDGGLCENGYTEIQNQ